MIIVPIKEGENIERALKKFKRKFEKTGTVRELRARKNFEKPSVKNRIAHHREAFREESHCSSEGRLRAAAPPQGRAVSLQLHLIT